MKAATREWVAKAEADFLGANGLYRRRKRPLWDLVCFHAQQSVEKYLKARLSEAGLSIPKTHDLLHLLTLASTVEPLWAAYYSAFSLLASYAVQIRYPGSATTKVDAQNAMKLCRNFRKDARRTLGLR